MTLLEELNRPVEKYSLKTWLNMKVKVEYLGFIKNLLNKRVEEIELSKGASLQELLSDLSNLYGTLFKKEIFEPGQKDVKTGFVVTVNGVLIGQLDDVETSLRNGDQVILMSLMSGG
ncbi:MoaD/ThiS family protein [Candidatus Bathyarchaeota archaeon]|nr:MoaD/ThiS family protein [Candidatus Bathyarchaeota archaeon]